LKTNNMENSVTIQVQGGASVSQVSPQVATFEQAFLGEDFSNLKGKGRARRKKRKLTRISDKQEVKQARKGGRQEARIGRRATRKAQRQDIRADQQGARMSRRGERIAMKEDRELGRQGRKDIRSQRGAERENYETEQDIYRESLYPEDDYSEETNDGYEDEGSGYEDEYETPQAYENQSELEEGYEDDSAPMYEEETGTTEEEYDSEDSGFISEATGKTISKKPITKKPNSLGAVVQEVCMKIEWNNEFIDRLKQKRDTAAKQGVSPEKYNAEIVKRMNRVNELEGQLENFSGADGDSYPSRVALINRSKNQARRARLRLHQGKGMNPMSSMQGYELSDWDTTDLDPGVIVETSASLPAQDDVFYYGDDRNVMVDLSSGEPKMNFSGEDSSKGSMLKSVIIGAVVAFGAIWLIKKYKLLK
jgi:hypothetical protein